MSLLLAKTFIGNKNLFSVQKRSLLPENLLFGQSPRRWQKMLENSSLSSQLEIHWVLSGWFENSTERLTWNYTTGIKFSRDYSADRSISKYCKFWLCPITLQKLKRADVLKWLKQHDDSPAPQDHQMSSAGSLKIAPLCRARGKSWESGTALEIISLTSVSCGFFFSPKTELFENKGFKISRQRWVCGLPLFHESPWLVVLQCQQNWSLRKDLEGSSFLLAVWPKCH